MLLSGYPQRPGGMASGHTQSSPGCLCISKRGFPKRSHGCSAESNSRAVMQRATHGLRAGHSAVEGHDHKLFRPLLHTQHVWLASTPVRASYFAACTRVVEVCLPA